MLVILCTVRGVYTMIEQPASSVMDWFPDFAATAELIKKHIGPGVWQEAFLSSPQLLH